MAKKQVRGDILLGTFGFIKKKWGSTASDQCARAVGIGPDEVKPGSWYDQRFDAAAQKWIADNKGEEQLGKLGAHMIGNMGFLLTFVRFLDVGTILNKMPSNYKRAYDFGEVTASVGKGKAAIRMVGCCADERACEVWAGRFRGVLALKKAKGTVERRACTFGDGGTCEFEVGWE